MLKLNGPTMKKLILLLLLFTLSSCGTQVSDEVLLAAHAAYQSRNAMIVDVRTPEEYKAKHIPGARNFPLQSLTKDFKKLPRNKKIILYCRSGNRSSTAAKFLKQQGYEIFDVATQSEWQRGAELFANKAAP